MCFYTYCRVKEAALLCFKLNALKSHGKNSCNDPVDVPSLLLSVVLEGALAASVT
jgi:hypothetical protein